MVLENSYFQSDFELIVLVVEYFNATLDLTMMSHLNAYFMFVLLL